MIELGSFTYDALPGRIVFGRGSATDRIVEEIERLEARRVVLIATEQERALAETVASPLGDRVADVFTSVRPHVPVSVAEEARERVKRADADVLLSVGGGSTTGTAKAVALEVPVAIAAVPTTYAGSEMTPVWGLTEAKRKVTGRSLSVLPKVVVYDPELTLTLPGSVTGPSAMNAVAHCVEALYVPGANPVISLLAAEGIRALAAGAPAAVDRPDDLEGRTQALYGAYLAGAAFAAVGGGLHHKICHTLGGMLDLPHAETHTIVLPHVMAFYASAVPDVAQTIATALASDDAASGLYDLGRRVGAPPALADVGMNADDFDAVVPVVLEGVAGSEGPRPADEESVRGIIEAAFEGARPAPTAAEVA